MYVSDLAGGRGEIAHINGFVPNSAEAKQAVSGLNG